MSNAATQMTAFLTALNPVLEAVQALDLTRPELAMETLEATFPVQGQEVQAIAAQMRRGVDEGWLCNKEHGGVRFSRPKKPSPEATLSIDAVHMNAAGPGHAHPNGEVDLCFAVEGDPTFDARAPGWTVYAPGSWHVPTVAGGTMDILYFLPDGAITFGPKEA